MKPGVHVRILRRWDEPKTKTVVTGDGISREISLNDFVKAMKAEIGSVTWTFKDETFSNQIDEAVKRVIEGLG